MLSHYRVLDLAGDRGEFAGFLLASLGADVIMVEPPQGSPSRACAPFLADEAGPERSFWHLAYNRAKRSVTIDLDTAEGLDRFLTLVGGADVVIEGWPPGYGDGIGLGRDAMAAANPSLIHVSVTPSGSEGPWSRWAATDLTVMASASPLKLTGDRDRPPVRVSVPQAFLFGGAVAAGAALMALQERSRSGRGQHVDVSAQQAAALASQTGLLAGAVDAPFPVRSAGGVSIGAMSLRFLYPAKDGHVSITHAFGEVGGPATAKLMAWAHEAGFCDQATRDKDWIRYPLLVDSGAESLADWERVKNEVATFTASLTKAELLAGAVRRQLLLAPVSDLAEVMANGHFAQRRFFEEIELPGTDRRVPAPGPFARFSRMPPARLSRAPDLGEHTAEVLGQPSRSPAVPPVATTSNGNGGVLAGVKVLDLTWSVAGPAMTRVLADHGATVVKLESVRRLDAARTFMPFHHNEAGVENSALFDNMNAGKLSAAVKLSEPAGREVLADLVRWADVVVDSLSPRGHASLGLDEATILALNPSVVAMSTSLFGLDGPLSALAGYGNLGAALSGFYEMTGWADRAPAGPYLAYTDYASSHVMLVALLAALDHRHRTGLGQAVDLSQTEAALHYLSPALLDSVANGDTASPSPTRRGNDDHSMAPHGVYRCLGDDDWVAIACADDPQWVALCELMDRPDLAADLDLATAARRLAQRRRLGDIVAAWTAKQPPDEVVAKCQARGVAARIVQGSAECLADAQFRHRNHVVELSHPSRRCVVEGTRFLLSRTPGTPRVRAPFLGEHTYEVLTEMLGYDGGRVADLAAAGILE